MVDRRAGLAAAAAGNSGATSQVGRPPAIPNVLIYGQAAALPQQEDESAPHGGRLSLQGSGAVRNTSTALRDTAQGLAAVPSSGRPRISYDQVALPRPPTLPRPPSPQTPTRDGAAAAQPDGPDPFRALQAQQHLLVGGQSPATQTSEGTASQSPALSGLAGAASLEASSSSAGGVLNRLRLTNVLRRTTDHSLPAGAGGAHRLRVTDSGTPSASAAPDMNVSLDAVVQSRPGTHGGSLEGPEQLSAGLGFQPVAWHIGLAESPRVPAHRHRRDPARLSRQGAEHTAAAGAAAIGVPAAVGLSVLPPPMLSISTAAAAALPEGDAELTEEAPPAVTLGTPVARSPAVAAASSVSGINGFQPPGDGGAPDAGDHDNESSACSVIFHGGMSDTGFSVATTTRVPQRAEAHAFGTPGTGETGTGSEQHASAGAAAGVTALTHPQHMAHVPGVPQLGAGTATPVRLAPVPEHRATKATRYIRGAALWLDFWWDVVSQLLFFATMAIDVVAAVYLITGQCGLSLFLPNLVFLALPAISMAILLLWHNGWLELCVHWFSTLVKRSDPRLHGPSWFIVDMLHRAALGITMLVMGIFGLIISGYCYLCFACVSLLLVPVLDVICAITTFVPLVAQWGKQRDVLFLENYKALRMPLQALLQSLPQAILMAYTLAVPHANGGCHAPTVVLALSLALAVTNVLAKAVYFVLQAAQQYGGRSRVRLLTGLKRQAQELLQFQGASRVPEHILEASLMKMLRSQSDFIVSDVLVDSSPQAPPGSAPLAAAATGSSSSGPGSSNGDDPRASAGSAAAAWVDASRRARPGCWCCPAPISAAFARLNGTLTFVPGFIVPWGSGQLAPGQVATIVKEAFARYPDRGITNWALEYASGDRCLNNMIRDGLSRFRSLQHLTICKCKVGGRGFQEVTSMLASHPQLRTLRLIKVEFDGHAAAALADLLKDSASITTLEIVSCTGLIPRSIVRLARALRTNTRLSTLLLTGCGVPKSGGAAFAELLQSNRTLRHLDLTGNKLGQGGAQTLADAIVACRGNLRLRIILSVADVGAAGAKAVVEALAKRRKAKLVEAWQQQQRELGRIGTLAVADVRHDAVGAASGPVWDETDEGMPGAQGTHQVGCYGVLMCGRPGHSSGGAGGLANVLGSPGRAPPASVVAQGALELPPMPAAESAASNAVGTGAAPAGGAGSKAKGRHQRSSSDASGGGLAGLANAILGGGSTAPQLPPWLDAPGPGLRFELHNTACCSVPIKGLPLTLMGGAGGTAALAQLVPGADAEERELEELAADQGHSGVLPVGDEAGAASDQAVTGGDVEVVLWLGSGEKDIIEAAYNSFRYLEGLTELNLSGLGIGDAGAQALAECVRQCTSLVSLDVSSNGITDSGMVALAQAVSQAPPQSALQLLDLSGNQACDDGALAIAAMIRARSAAAAPLPANATPDVLASGEAGAAAAGAGIIAAGAAGEPLLEAPDEGVEAAEEEVDADAAAAAAAAGAGAASGKIPQHKSLFSLPLRIPFISGHASSSAAAVAPPLGPPKPPLTIRMCDNHYPFSMDTLKELQSALSQPAGAAASAAQHASSAGPLAAAALGPPVLPHGPPAAPSSGAAAAAAAATGASLSMASPLLSVMPLVVLEMVKRPAGAAAGAKCTTTGRGVQQPQTGSACAANAPAGGTGGHHSRNASHVSQMSDSSDPHMGCGVCFDNPNNLTIRGCGHKLCVQCYRQLVKPDAKKGATCPFCRAPIQGFEYRGWPAKF